MKFLAVIVAAIATVAQASPQVFTSTWPINGLTYMGYAATVAGPECFPERVEACKLHFSAYPNGINCDNLCSLCDLCDAVENVDGCKYCSQGVAACADTCKRGIQVCSACTFGK